MKCPKCKKDTLKHVCDHVHGIPGAIMRDSERFECKCGFYAGDKETAKKNNLKLIMDT